MSRVIQPAQRDNVLQSRSGENLILTNERTGASVTIPRHASAAERRAARAKVQEQTADPFAGVSAKEAMARCFGTPEQKSDGPPIVAQTPGKLRNKQLAAAAEYERQREQERQRRREIEDRKALASDIVEGLKSTAAVDNEPAPVDLGDDYRRRLETTIALSKLRADPNATPDAIKAAELASREAWGFSAPEGEGGANE